MPPSIGAVAGEAVAAAADRELELVVAGEADRVGDVARIGGPDDGERPDVDRRLVHLAGGLVFVVARQDQSTVEAAAERFEIERLDKEGAAEDRGFQGLCSSWGWRGWGVCV